jgi:hypothetical protein
MSIREEYKGVNKERERVCVCVSVRGNHSGIGDQNGVTLDPVV